ncbi:MAG: PD-(D/E)XK nuclease family protein [Candidatus Hydrogenedentales bacterium]|jgi:ATP-dependent helicase/DNAse subunit B
MGAVDVLAGPEGSARTERLDRLLAEQWGRALLLTPTHLFARKRLEELLVRPDIPGAWGTPVSTLQRFAETILQGADPDALPLNDLERRLVLQEALQRLRSAGELEDVGPGSETAGFLRHLLRVFENLKQAAVEPEEFLDCVQRRRHPAALDLVVARAYQEYQAALIERQAYDRIGVYWQARQLLEGPGDLPVLQGIELVALDGFDDFTESEFRLVAALRERVDRLVFSMRTDKAPGGADLYRLQRQTLMRLETTFEPSIEWLPPRLPTTASQHAAAYLLWRDDVPPVEGLASNLEVVPCAGATEEVETIGRAIKTLILDGVPAAEIAIVYADLEQARNSLRSMGREFQIPLRVHGDDPLASSSVCAFVLDALEASDGWKHGEIVDLLTAPWMDTDDADEALTGALPVVCRQAGIVAGHKQWVRRLLRMRVELSRSPRDRQLHAGQLLRRHPRLLDAVITAEARVKRLSRALGMLPATDELHGFCRATANFLDALALGDAVRRCAPESIRAREIAALEALQELLGRLDARQFSMGGPQTRGDFARFLRQTCGEQSFHAPETPRERRGVRCLGLRSVRGLRFRHVFVGGLNEGIVPGQPGVNAVYSEDDVRELRDAGIPLEPREVRTERELAAFHHVLEAAQDRIWLFWRTATPDGKPLLRSPFLNDLLRLFASKPVERTPLRASQYYPALSHAASHRDVINNLFATHTRLPEPLAAEFSAVVRGAAIEQRRYSPAAFDAFDGVLREERNRVEIAERYSEEHVFSATELEDYRKCPFRFFALRLLRMMPVERPVTAFDRSLLGIVIHQVLEEFHRRYPGVPVRAIPADEAEEAMRGIVDSVFIENNAAMLTVPDGMLMAERLSVHERLQRYLRIERREEVPWYPTDFEAVFGGPREKQYPPLAISTEAGLLRMRGRIDRIDRGEEGRRVVDYKTGRPPKAAHVREGVSLQLVAYALALEQVIAPGTVCEEGVLLQVGTTARLAVRESGLGTLWNQAKQGFFVGVSAALEGIRGASFPPLPQPDVCAYCDARRMCRIDASRVERKQGGAP